MRDDLKVTTRGVERARRRRSGSRCCIYTCIYDVFLIVIAFLEEPAHTQPIELTGSASCTCINITVIKRKVDQKIGGRSVFRKHNFSTKITRERGTRCGIGSSRCIYIYTHTYTRRVVLVYLIMRGKRSIKKSAGVLSFQTHNFLNKVTRNGERPEGDDGGGRSGRGGGGVDPVAVYIHVYMMYLTCYCNLIKPAHTQPMELNGSASCIYIYI